MDGLRWKYGGFVALAEHRVGESEGVTLGVSGGYSRESGFGGAAVAARLPIGELEIDVRGSKARGESGAAASALYLVRGRWLSLQGAARVFSPQYEEARPRDPLVDPRADAAASLNVLLFRGLSVGAQYRWWQNIEETRAEVGSSINLSLPKNVSLSVMATQVMSGTRPVTAVATLTVPLGQRSSASATQQSSAGRPDSRVALQRSLPLGPGLGYQMDWQHGNEQKGTAVIQYQNRWARVETRAEGWREHTTSSINVSGAVAALRQGLFLTRPITDAFALVQVPGARGVSTYLSNQFVGKTNRRGEIVVPSLGSYQANRVSINDGDLPLFVEADRVDFLIAPGLRGGGVVSVGVRQANESLSDVLKQLDRYEMGDPGVAPPDAPPAGRTAAPWSGLVATMSWPTQGGLLSWIASGVQLAHRYLQWQVETCLGQSVEVVSCDAIGR